VKSAGRITVFSGSVPVLVAWLIGIRGMPVAYQPVTDVLAEVLGLLLVVLAWRFRRGRIAVAAVFIGLANLLVRGPFAAFPDGTGRPVLAILLPLTIAVLALLPERPITRLQTILMSAVVLFEISLAAAFSTGVGGGIIELPESFTDLLTSPELGRMVFLVAGAFVALAFAARRGAFEGSLLWLLAAASLALLGDPDPHAATLTLAAAQLVLLLGLVEDSYRLAYHDELTGLPGRRALEEALRALDGDYAVAMVDVDHFKRFNDRHGHAAGDQALRMVAAELQKIKGGGRAYRYGGEEFAVVFPTASLPSAHATLESLRIAIADRKFAVRAPDRPRKKPDRPRKPTRQPPRIAVSVSIGLAGPTAQTHDPEAVLRAADRALYRAKSDGRNRLVAVGNRWRKIPG
jgi:diguanylate cyclase (GGDEF)-like protein